MKCKNCGWENPENNINCEKCKARLIRTDAEEPSFYQSNVQSDNRLKKTAFETGISGYSRESDHSEQVKANICSKCGYPIRANDVSCPNCGNSPEMQKTVVNSKNIRQDTVRQDIANPWIASKIEKRACTLTPVVKAGETADKAPLSFKGNDIILTRKNTEKGNKTITTKTQAILKYIDRSWYIEDKSELKTTFVHAGEMKQLKSGDIILMGDRQFIFND
ncbi:MAG: zinc ribbon domain-containing protein [Tannerella sp.]|jgi:predicted Zn-ribbon and HTH transcriptional regulator|nr:zinc ribbon domain-containing protein [Tannerella sp.]